MTGLPAAIAPLVGFAAVLRGAGFAVATDQTTSFLQAVAVLGPRGIGDIRRAAHATLAPPPERHTAFDALFDQHFLGLTGLVSGAGAPEGDAPVRVADDAPGGADPPEEAGTDRAGRAATGAERLTARRLDASGEAEALRRFARTAPARLPRRRGRRLAPSPRGRVPDLRRSLREAVRNDGDVARLRFRRRTLRPRGVLLLIDVSGSMKARTDAHLRFAHALAQAVARAAGRIEVFTLGTRLTRVSRAMRLARREQALAASAGLVADWDGGTRLGDALGAFLAVPKFAVQARGAAVLIVSDGLERGDPAALVHAVARLSRLAWRLSWLSPLAGDPGFRPQTQALVAIGPFLDALAPGATTAALCAHVLGLATLRTVRG